MQFPVDFHHYTCQLFMVPLVCAVRWALTKLFFKLSKSHGYPHNISVKISESCYYFVQYFALYCASFSLIRAKNIQPFNLDNFFQDYPDRIVFYYPEHRFMQLELSVYIVALVFIFFETRKNNSDFVVMLTHHAVSIALITTGYGFRHLNYGLLVANLHDVTDIFLEGSKVVNYTLGEPYSLATFVLFALAFFIARIVFYPAYLIYPIVNGEIFDVMDRVSHTTGAFEKLQHFRYVFLPILSMLLILDLMWMKTIVRMLLGILRLEVRGDVRDTGEVRTGRGREQKIMVKEM